MLKYLIIRGAYIHSKNNSNETALHMAAWNGRKKVVKYLLANGADT